MKANIHQEAQQRNEKLLAIIRKGNERLRNMPVRGTTEETLKMIQQARAGEMWGYESAEAKDGANN